MRKYILKKYTTPFIMSIVMLLLVLIGFILGYPIVEIHKVELATFPYWYNIIYRALFIFTGFWIFMLIFDLLYSRD